MACRDDDDASAADCEDEIIEDSATAAADARLQHCSIVTHVAAMLSVVNSRLLQGKAGFCRIALTDHT